MSKLSRVIFAALFASFSGVLFATLPDGYTEVEYVQSTCDQYVDTDYKPNAKTTIHFEFAVDKYDYRELTSSTSLKTDRDSAYVLACYNERCQFAYGSSSFMGFGTTYNNAVKLSNDTDSHCLEITNATFYIDGVSKYTGNTTFSQGSNQQPLYVFALNSIGTPKYLCAAKVYSLIISEDGVEKCHYIPAKDAKGNVGLYDTVTGGFYKSATTTALVAGPTVGPVNDDPKFSDFSVGADTSRVWEQVTVVDGTNYDVTVEAYMGTDPASWTAISTWTHSDYSATYAATNAEAQIGKRYSCAFKLSYEKGNETIVKWTSTNEVGVSGTVHWSGKGADDKWMRAENWQEGVVPTPDLTSRFEKEGVTVVTAGDEALASKGVYVTQGTTIWDFQPETTLAMTYLHMGVSGSKTTADLIVSNGVINATGSVGFDSSNGSVWFVGTKATFREKTYLLNVGQDVLKVTDGAAVKLADWEQAGNSKGEDSIFVGKDSALTFASISVNSHANVLTVDGGVITNTGVFALGGRGDNSQLGSKLVVKNGGRLVQNGTFKLNCWYNNSCEVIDGGVLEAKAINIGNEADSGSGGKLIVSNATVTATSIAVCADDRHQSQRLYLYEDEGESSSIIVSGDFVVATSGTNTRNGKTNRVSINGGDLSVGGNLRIGTPFATEQTNKFTIARANSKVTAASLTANNNSEIVVTLPVTGFDETPMQITGKATFNHTSGLKLDVSSAKPGVYTVLTASEFAGLDDADVALVNTGKYQADIIRTETSVGVKVKSSGLTLIYR